VFDQWRTTQRTANTGEVRLLPGLAYVFAVSGCASVERISAWLNTGDGNFDRVESLTVDTSLDPLDRRENALAFNVERAGNYHFQVDFVRDIYQYGMIALYQIGQG
ncbi:MAG: hypothetical protein Q9183_006433, partial [Haloplaca sp. 2 TL-2023]